MSDESTEQKKKPDKVKYVAGVSPWTFCMAIGLFFTIGYIVAWAMCEHDELAMVYGVFAALFMWFLRKPMQWWASYVNEKNKELQSQKKLEEKFGMTGEESVVPKPKKKEKGMTYAFTSEDFDDKSRAMLVPIVKQSRKAKALVSAEGLINEILKSFR